MDTFCALNEETLNTKFVLKQINPGQLDRQYILKDLQELGIDELSKELRNDHDTLSKVTSSLEQIGYAKAKTKPFDTIMVNDDLNIRLFVSPNHIQALKPLTEMRKYNCWFCRHSIPYEWHPIGIPIKHKLDANRIDCFECEGVFCSFNCCVAYLSEHYDYRFKDSTVLLLMMYRKLFKHMKQISSIVPSPSWKLLKEYGGHLSIDDFRKCLQHVEYKSMCQILMKQDIKLAVGSELYVET